MKIGQNDLENLYFLLIIKTYHFFIQFSFKIGFLCFVPSGNVQKKCTLHVPFSFMLNEKGGACAGILPKTAIKMITKYCTYSMSLSIALGG